jgi:hypothetical protein
MRFEPEQEQEGIRQNELIHGGLIAIAVVMIQPFLVAPSLDLSATISVVAFAVAIPLLGWLILVGRQESFRRRPSRSAMAVVAKSIGEAGAAVGVVAGFWHIWWVAGVAVLASGVLGMAAHSAAWWRLEQDHLPKPGVSEGGGGMGSHGSPPDSVSG